MPIPLALFLMAFVLRGERTARGGIPGGAERELADEELYRRFAHTTPWTWSGPMAPTISTRRGPEPKASHVVVKADVLVVDLADGRTIITPLAWFPRLVHGTPAERSRWVLLGDGVGIHWPDLDEDISVNGLLRGGPSRESQSSIRKWLESRAHAVDGSRRRIARSASKVPPEAPKPGKARAGKHA